MAFEFEKIKNKPTPRWIIFAIDCSICLLSLFLAYQLRFNFQVPESEKLLFNKMLPAFLIVRIGSFILFKIYAGIIRYTSTKDAQRVFTLVISGSVIFSLINFINRSIGTGIYIMPFSVIIIEFMSTMMLLITYRIVVKILYFELKNPTKEKSSIMIYGAGEAGIIAKRTLDRDAGSKYKVIGFFDDNKNIIGKKIEGATVYRSNTLEEVLKEGEVTHLIISPQTISQKKKQEIIEICVNNNVRVLNVPPASKWINGELSFKQIQKVKIEDLLGRDPIKLDESNIEKLISKKIILVSGAAGSIGSGLVKQILNYKPKKIILLDSAESPLYDLEMELCDQMLTKSIEVVIGDIRNIDRMEHLFKSFQPQIVFHAAAYKHVPMMENNPSEAVNTNINGTKILADMSVKYKVEKFVMVSTDKAVNPTNVMGASKRVAEIYVQSLSKNSSTKFITTRFGNVLGSNGSVIPRFRKQIEKGGPITLTHPEITRYFMTIPESCQLVLEAGAMGSGGEIFVFDMGKSVRILDLAKKMIKLSGLELGKDIQIIYTGLRPGEKLYEELLNNAENTLPTHHPQILIGKVREYDLKEVEDKVNHIIALFPAQNNFEMVACIKELVPEYVSNNSEFEKLDNVPKHV